jgi:PAS domain S-box-containing protein
MPDQAHPPSIEQEQDRERLRRVGELNPECFRQLADNVSDVFYILDLRSPQMLYVSPAYARVWGRPVRSLYEEPGSWLSVVHPEDRPRVGDVGSRERHLTWNMEYRVLRADGTIRWISDRAFPVLDDEGVPYRIAGIARDITERKQAEALNRRAREDAERTSMAKSAFLANMSHELVTPLNSVIGFSELLADGAAGDLNELQAQYLGNVVASGRHLLDLVNDVRDLAKIEAGRMQIEPQRTDLGALLAENAHRLAVRAREQRIDLSIEIDPDLPLVEVDPLRLQQVILHLIGNALKFTAAGGRITIRAGSWRGLPLAPGAAVGVSVADTGIGIAPADQERVFAAFEQLDNGYGRRQQGSGLGLAVARRLVELHGGRLWVESAGPGLGSVFSFIVPVHASAAALDSAVS